MHLQSREIVSPSNRPGRSERESFQVGPEHGYTLCRYPFARAFDVFRGSEDADSGMGGAFADGFFGEESLLADAVGDFGEFALIGANSGKVIGLADEIKRAEGFPDLLVARVDGSDFGARGYVRARCHEEGADAAADGRTKFEGSRFVLGGFRGGIDLELGNQTSLVDGGSRFIGIRNVACEGSDDSGGLEERDDLGAAGIIAKADQRKSGVAADHRRRILEHLEERFVKARRGSVLAHDPGVGVANFFDGMRSEADQLRVPACRSGVVVAHALAKLDEGMLDVARMLFVLQVFGDLFVRKPAAKPGV